jgi:hypothetical protein
MTAMPATIKGNKVSYNQINVIITGSINAQIADAIARLYHQYEV